MLNGSTAISADMLNLFQSGVADCIRHESLAHSATPEFKEAVRSKPFVIFLECNGNFYASHTDEMHSCHVLSLYLLSL